MLNFIDFDHVYFVPTQTMAGVMEAPSTFSSGTTMSLVARTSLASRCSKTAGSGTIKIALPPEATFVKRQKVSHSICSFGLASFLLK